MDQKVKFCPNCGAQIYQQAEICNFCGEKQPDLNVLSNKDSSETMNQEKINTETLVETRKNVSLLWFLLPLIFMIIGGVIAWSINRKKDPVQARNMLWLGLIVTLVFIWANWDYIWFFIYWYI